MNDPSQKHPDGGKTPDEPNQGNNMPGNKSDRTEKNLDSIDPKQKEKIGEAAVQTSWKNKKTDSITTPKTGKNKE